MDTNTIMDLVSSYAVIVIPIITGLIAVVKKALPETIQQKFLPLISIILGIAASFLVAGVSRDSSVMGIIMGLSASGLWSTATSPFKKKG